MSGVSFSTPLLIWFGGGPCDAGPDDVNQQHIQVGGFRGEHLAELGEHVGGRGRRREQPYRMAGFPGPGIHVLLADLELLSLGAAETVTVAALAACPKTSRPPSIMLARMANLLVMRISRLSLSCLWGIPPGPSLA